MKTQLSALAAAAMLSALPSAAQAVKPLFPLAPPVVSTIPANGDVNPYGVAFVPRGVLPGGLLEPNDILVSNFNNAQNLQRSEEHTSELQSRFDLVCRLLL